MARNPACRGSSGVSLTVITPVGPGHEAPALIARETVRNAALGPFDDVHHLVIHDERGNLGRSAARNLGIKDAETDWLFFLDADDRLRTNALENNDFDSPSTFGAVSLDGIVTHRNVYPCTFQDIALKGARGTLTMGFFCKTEIARQLMFNESMDAGEDFDFYLRLPAFTKRPVPLVDIGYSVKSATGPRGYEKIDWIEICNKQIAKAVEREPEKFNLGHHAVLEAANSPARQRSKVA